MRRSEAERYAFRGICFNRPFEASRIIEARQRLGMNTGLPKAKPVTPEVPKQPTPPKTEPLFKGRKRFYY